MLEEKRRVERVSRYFLWLQGLQLIPFATFLILAGILKALDVSQGLGVSADHWDLALWLGGMLFILIPTFRIARYYQRDFGNVQVQRNQLLYTLLLVWAMILIWWIINDLILTIRTPVSVFAIAIGFLLISMWLLTQRFRWHYLAMGILMIVLGLFPLWSLPNFFAIHTLPMSAGQLERVSLADTPGITITLGLILLIGGLGDHLLLLRNLVPLRQERRYG